jgi:hypothetical protein
MFAHENNAYGLGRLLFLTKHSLTLSSLSSATDDTTNAWDIWLMSLATSFVQLVVLQAMLPIRKACLRSVGSLRPCPQD